MRSLTSPDTAPLYWPTQARSDWIARRSAGGIALAVSAGVCRAGRIGTVTTRFGFAPTVDGGVDCPCAETLAATNIDVAVSIDLMTSLLMTRLGSIDVGAIKHIWLVGNNRRRVQRMVAKQPSLPAINEKRLHAGVAEWKAGRSAC